MRSARTTTPDAPMPAVSMPASTTPALVDSGEYR
jgi:hypothetical protein